MSAAAHLPPPPPACVSYNIIQRNVRVPNKLGASEARTGGGGGSREAEYEIKESDDADGRTAAPPPPRK